VALWVVMLTAIASALDYYRRFQRLLVAKAPDLDVGARKVG
jgi:hypothetical protein